MLKTWLRTTKKAAIHLDAFRKSEVPEFKGFPYQDGINADRNASDYTKAKSQVKSSTKLKITLAPGGGWAARIHH